jgi:hypothetical protein
VVEHIDLSTNKRALPRHPGYQPNGRSGSAARTGLQRLTETTMSNLRLPAEILDHIVDNLHDTEDALRNCSLVSKSWIPRIRKHLFANVEFPTPESLESWKAAFPDPLTSPARHAETLLIECPQVVTVADAEAGGWITGFSRVARLEVGARGPFVVPVSFVPFHGFSPLIKSLCDSFYPFIPTYF